MQMSLISRNMTFYQFVGKNIMQKMMDDVKQKQRSSHIIKANADLSWTHNNLLQTK